MHGEAPEESDYCSFSPNNHYPCNSTIFDWNYVKTQAQNTDNATFDGGGLNIGTGIIYNFRYGISFIGGAVYHINFYKNASALGASGNIDDLIIARMLRINMGLTFSM